MGREPNAKGAWGERALLVCLLTSLAACRTEGLRAVVDARPAIEVAEIVEAAGALSIDDEPPTVEALRAELEPAVMLLSAVLHRGAGAMLPEDGAVLPAILGERSPQLDPALGPMDLGYPLLVDLGAGDAPYDDGVHTLHAEEVKRGGFSDTVIQVVWRETLQPGWSLTGGASMFREQDLAILDGLDRARFGWATVGISVRF